MSSAGNDFKLLGLLFLLLEKVKCFLFFFFPPQDSFMVQERPNEDVKQNCDTSSSLFEKCMWVAFLLVTITVRSTVMIKKAFE